MNYHIQQLGTSIRCYVGLPTSPAIGEHSRFTEHRWRMAVRRRETKLGYGEWVADQVQAEFVDFPVKYADAPVMGAPV